MPEIPYETGAYYVFDRGYNNFGELYRIQRMESFFVVRAKTNLQYRCVRWQIELFFKWLKQHLKIKKFWGTTENAVRIQISAAITAYCLVAIVQHDMQLKRSTYEVLQILSISLTDKTPLRELFDKTYSNDVKEQLDPLIPGLFD